MKPGERVKLEIRFSTIREILKEHKKSMALKMRMGGYSSLSEALGEIESYSANYHEAVMLEQQLKTIP